MQTIKSWFWPGVITIALLTALAVWFLTDPIDRELTETANNALETGNPWASAEIDGRDLVLKGIAPSEEALAEALKIVSETRGVRVCRQSGDTFAFGCSVFLRGHQVR